MEGKLIVSPAKIGNLLLTDFAYVISSVAEYDAVARRQGDQQNYIFFLKLLSKLTLMSLTPLYI